LKMFLNLFGLGSALCAPKKLFWPLSNLH
jgi:hypothetical protein